MVSYRNHLPNTNLKTRHYPVPPPEPPVKRYQMPEDPVNTRDIKKSYDNLLYSASKILLRFGHAFKRSKRDKKGIVALEYPNFLLVAKKYLWHGYKVSVHKTVLDYAVRKQKPVVMYIEENGWFYELDAERILMDDETKPNVRGYDRSQTMMNFNIRLGNRIFKPQTKLEV